MIGTDTHQERWRWLGRRSFIFFLVLIGTGFSHLDGLTVSIVEACPDPDSETVPELVAAAAAGDLARVKDLVEAGAAVNPPEPEGEGDYYYPWGTPLRSAAANGHLEVMDYLIAHGAAITGEAGYTALYEAVQNGQLGAIRYLQGKGVPITEEQGPSLLGVAINSGQFEVVKYLFEASGIGDSITLNDGPLLFCAVRSNQPAIVAYLLKRGAAFDGTVPFGAPSSNLLSIASESGFSEIVELLVRAGADPEEPAGNGWTAVMNAAAQGQLETVKRLVALGANIRKFISPEAGGGTSAIGLAAAGSHWEVVQYLIDRGADINTRDQEGTTILMLAAADGDTNTVTVLLSRGADINAVSRTQGTALVQAVQKRNREMVELLLESGANLFYVCPDRERPPEEFSSVVEVFIWGLRGWMEAGRVYGDALTAAVASRDCTMVRFLVSRGAVPDSDAMSAAIAAGDSELMKCLFDLGAKVSGDEMTGARLLVEAVEMNQPDLVRMLLDHGVDIRAGYAEAGSDAALQRALLRGHFDLAQTLIDWGAEVNSHDASGYTPLMKVSGWGYYETVKRYVEQYGADVNAKSDNGITPLMEAARGGNSDVIHYLLQRGADARVWTVDHKNILYFATIRCDSQTLADLIAAGAEVNPPNGSGYVPLNKAAETGRMDIIKFLVNGYHAQVNLRDAAGYTALMLASAQGHLDIVKLLIEEYGAEINLKSDSGWTALLMAAWSNAPEVTKYLLERGADTAARDPDNRTALHLAVDRRDYPAVAALLAAGVDVNARGWAGETAIYYVVADVKPHLHGGMEILKLLVESGADLTIRSDAGQTVLDIADERREQRPDIYNYLHSVAGNQ